MVIMDNVYLGEHSGGKGITRNETFSEGKTRPLAYTLPYTLHISHHLLQFHLFVHFEKIIKIVSLITFFRVC